MSLKELLHKITDKKTLQLLEQYLPQASVAQEDGAWMYDKGLTNREYIEEIERLLNGLQKIMDNRGTFKTAFKSIRLAIKTLPEKDLEVLPTYCKEMTLLAMQPDNVFRNVFIDKLNSLEFYTLPLDRQIIASRLHIIVNKHRGNLNNVGKGNARSQAKKYIPGITYLAKRFKETVSTHGISTKDDSMFFIYVMYWLENFEGNPVTPERHIKNAILDNKRWKQIN